MKVITANRLSDGAVVYIGAGGDFVERFEHARLFEAAEADAFLSDVLARKTAIAAAYAIDADATGPVGREALRESIRKNGPTIRTDLGKQAEARDERL